MDSASEVICTIINPWSMRPPRFSNYGDRTLVPSCRPLCANCSLFESLFATICPKVSTRSDLWVWPLSTKSSSVSFLIYHLDCFQWFPTDKKRYKNSTATNLSNRECESLSGRSRLPHCSAFEFEFLWTLFWHNIWWGYHSKLCCSFLIKAGLVFHQ